MEERIVWQLISPKIQCEFSCDNCSASSSMQKRVLLIGDEVADYWTYCGECCFAIMRVDMEAL